MCCSERRRGRRSPRSSAAGSDSRRSTTGRSTASRPRSIRGSSVDDITELFVTAMMQPNATTAQKLQRIGAVALSTATVAEPVRRDVIAHRLPSHDWPDRVLRVTAIDTATGELVAFDRGSGVGLVDAVAASCAVPGAWPPVTIGTAATWTVGWAARSTCRWPPTATLPWCWCRTGENSPSPFGGGAAAEIADFRGSAFGVFADESSARRVRPESPGPRVPRAVGTRGARTGSPTGWRGRRVPARLTHSSSAGVSEPSQASRAVAASSCPTSITSSARWNSRLRHAERGTSMRMSGG